MIAVALACFLAGLMVGLVVGSPSGLTANRRVHGDAHGAVPIKPRQPNPNLIDAQQTPPVRAAVPSFRLRPRFVQRRAKWEAAHNTKQQRNAALADQIRKAQEGTLT